MVEDALHLEPGAPPSGGRYPTQGQCEAPRALGRRHPLPAVAQHKPQEGKLIATLFFMCDDALVTKRCHQQVPLLLGHIAEHAKGGDIVDVARPDYLAYSNAPGESLSCKNRALKPARRKTSR